MRKPKALPQSVLPEQLKKGQSMELNLTCTVMEVTGKYESDRGTTYEVLFKLPGRHAGVVRKLVTIEVI